MSYGAVNFSPQRGNVGQGAIWETIAIVGAYCIRPFMRVLHVPLCGPMQ